MLRPVPRISAGENGAGKLCVVRGHPAASRGFLNSARALLALLTLESALINFAVAAAAGDGGTGSAALALHNSARIPFKLYQGYVIVMQGSLGDLDHQNLLLDTGTNPSMIDTRAAAQLGLHGMPRNVSLFNQHLISENVTLPSLHSGSIQKQNFPVVVADLSRLGRELGTRIDAVIGLDVLGGRNFTLDYEKKHLVLGASNQAHAVPFTAGPQFIGVDLKAGSRQLHLLVDTGTPQLVLFRNHLSDVDYTSTSRTGSGQNISSDVSYEAIVLLQARLGTQQIGPQSASVVTSQQEITTEYDGLIGLACMRPKRVSFDFEHQVLGWSD